MGSQFFRDDNGSDGYGIMRPVFSTSGIKSATTGAAITELDISALSAAANASEVGAALVLRIVCAGTNPCYFSLGAGGAAPGANTAMVIIPQNVEVFMKATTADASCYHLQITGASTLQVSVVK